MAMDRTHIVSPAGADRTGTGSGGIGRHLSNLIGPPRPTLPARRQSHRPERPPCAYCPGDGTICNPGNADPSVKVTDWLYPVACPRCGGTGKDPNP